MVKKYLFVMMLINIFNGCAQRETEPKKNIVSCVLLGYDSLAYYYGNSEHVGNSVSGLISDSNFVKTFTQSIKDHSSHEGFKIAIKPTASANVGVDFKWLVDLLNSNDFQLRYIDTLDENEREKFNTVSIQQIMNKQSSQLILPGDENRNATLSDTVDVNTLTILVFGENGLYLYLGNDVGSGKKYDYADLKKFFGDLKRNNRLRIVIKSSANNTYRNTVNILDEMSKNQMDKYQLIDMNPEEEKFISGLTK